jgi:hypothetical protein
VRIPYEIETGIFWCEPGNLSEANGKSARNWTNVVTENDDLEVHLGRLSCMVGLRCKIIRVLRTNRDGWRTSGKSACSAKLLTGSAICRLSGNHGGKGKCGNRSGPASRTLSRSFTLLISVQILEMQGDFAEMQEEASPAKSDWNSVICVSTYSKSREVIIPE